MRLTAATTTQLRSRRSTTARPAPPGFPMTSTIPTDSASRPDMDAYECMRMLTLPQQALMEATAALNASCVYNVTVGPAGIHDWFRAQRRANHRGLDRARVPLMGRMQALRRMTMEVACRLPACARSAIGIGSAVGVFSCLWGGTPMPGSLAVCRTERSLSWRCAGEYDSS
eukprot:COSAG06_NODE_5442_length_3480_cov_1.991425_2_plen_171_part_00